MNENMHRICSQITKHFSLEPSHLAVLAGHQYRGHRQTPQTAAQRMAVRAIEMLVAAQVMSDDDTEDTP